MDGEIQFGHLYVILRNGTGIVLDGNIFPEEIILETPLFHLNTDDIEEADKLMKEKKVELSSGIQYNIHFNLKVPDGNQLMGCQYEGRGKKMDLLPYIVVPAVILILAVIKVKDLKHNRRHPDRQWEGERPEADEQRRRDAEKDAAVRRGAGNAGGPMG